MEKQELSGQQNTPWAGMQPPPITEDYQPLKMESQDFQHVPNQPQFTVVNLPEPFIRDHLVWSIVTFVYMNCLCLGLPALIYSVKARDRKMMGDFSGAKNYSYRASSYNIIATFLTLLFMVVVIILMTKGIIHMPKNSVESDGNLGFG